MLTHLFYRLLRMSVAGSLLILLIMACRPFTTKLCSKKWHYYLWLIVIGVLILPLQFQFLSFQTPLRKLTPPMDTATVYEQSPVINSETNNLPVDTSPAENNNTGVNFGSNEPFQKNTFQDLPATENLQDLSGYTNRPYYLRAAAHILPLLWLVGCVGLAVIKLFRFQRFISYLKQTSWEFSMGNTPHGLLQYFMDFKTSYIQTPFLMGLSQPVIYLPNIEWTPEELEMTLTHEVIHAQRKDIHYKLLMQFILCLHWFNPLVHWMNKDLQQYCELSCDEAVIAKMNPDKKKAYMLTIVKLVEKAQSVPENLAAAMSAPSCKTERRIHEMISQKKPSRGIFRYSSIVIAAVFFFSGVVAASEIGQSTSAPEQTPVLTAAEEEAGFNNDASWQNFDDFFNNVNLDQNNYSYYYNDNKNRMTETALLATLYDEAKLVEYDLSNIQSLELKLDTASIEVVKGDAPKLKYYQWSDLEYGLTAQNGKLTLESNPQKISMIYTNGSSGSWVEMLVKSQGKALDPEGNTKRIVTITLPEQYLFEQARLQTGTGSIATTLLGATGKLDLETGTGRVDLQNAQGSEIYATSGTGSVNGKNLTATKLELESGTGKVLLENSQQDHLSVSSGTGKVLVSNASGNTAVIECGTGTSAIKDSTFTSYDLISGSGSLYVLGGQGKKVSAETGTGSIRILQVDGLEDAYLSTATGSGYVQLTAPASGYSIWSGNISRQFSIDGESYKEQKTPVNPGAVKSIVFEGSTGTLYVEGPGHYTENLAEYKADVFGDLDIKTPQDSTDDNGWYHKTYNAAPSNTAVITANGDRMETTNNYPADSIHSIKIRVNATQVSVQKSTSGQFEGVMSIKQNENIAGLTLKMFEEEEGVLTIEGKVDYTPNTYYSGSLDPKLVLSIPDKLYDLVALDLNAVYVEQGTFSIQAKELTINNNASSITMPVQASESILANNNAGNLELILQQEPAKTDIRNNAGNLALVFAKEPTDLNFTLDNTMGSGKVPSYWKANETSNRLQTSSKITYTAGNGRNTMEINNNSGYVSVSVGR